MDKLLIIVVVFITVISVISTFKDVPSDYEIWRTSHSVFVSCLFCCIDITFDLMLTLFLGYIALQSLIK